MKKWLILGMMQEKYRMSLEHLTVSVGKEMLFKKEEEKKKNKRTHKRGRRGECVKGTGCT